MNLDELDDLLDDHPKDEDDTRIIRAPFRYHGSKTRSLPSILPHLPTLDIWVDVFGGSGAVTLGRKKSRKLDVFNDRWSGVCAFFKCVRDPVKRERMVEQLSLMPHSKEDFYDCKATWEQQTADVDRAVRWYYLMNTSYGALARNWGYGRSQTFSMAFKQRLTLFNEIADRFLDIQIDNDDFRVILDRYDSYSTVFYCDPPYLDSHQPGSYVHKMSHQDHTDLLDQIHTMKGYVAVSSYKNNLYDSYAWDDVHIWRIHSNNHGAETASNHRIGAMKVKFKEECLYIKETDV